MTAPRFIEIDGKRHAWREIVKLRQEQCRAIFNHKEFEP